MEETTIEQRMRDADELGQIIKAKEEDVEVDGLVGKVSLENADHICIYDTKTGEMSRVPRNMLGQLLQLKRNGEYIFTTKKPPFEPKKGGLKCMLHKDDPNRKHYDDLGFPVCRKEGIPNQHQLKEHMRRRHPQEWATIEDERKEAAKQAEREFQMAILKAASGQNVASGQKDADGQKEEAPLYVSKKDRLAKGVRS